MCDPGFDGLETLSLSESDFVTFSAPTPSYTNVRLVVSQGELEEDFTFFAVDVAQKPELTVWTFSSAFANGMQPDAAVLRFEGLDAGGAAFVSTCEITLVD